MVEWHILATIFTTQLDWSSGYCVEWHYFAFCITNDGFVRTQKTIKMEGLPGPRGQEGKDGSPGPRGKPGPIGADGRPV